MRTAHLALGVALLTGMMVGDASAADRIQIASLNVVIQGIVTTVSAAVQGHVHRPADVIQTFASGAVSGFGMYQAKSLVGKGHVTSGWLLANAAGSVSENVVDGRHPLAQFGYSIGPFRIRVPIPRFDAHPDSYAYMDVSGVETFAFLYSVAGYRKLGLRSGLIVFSQGRNANSPLGSTTGIFPRLSHPADVVWFHEAIHAIQSLQGDVLEPSLGFLSYKPARTASGAKRIIRFEHLKVGLVTMGSAAWLNRGDYEDRWPEIEAYRLGEDRRPLPID